VFARGYAVHMFARGYAVTSSPGGVRSHVRQKYAVPYSPEDVLSLVRPDVYYHMFARVCAITCSPTSIYVVHVRSLLVSLAHYSFSIGSLFGFLIRSQTWLFNWFLLVRSWA